MCCGIAGAIAGRALLPPAALAQSAPAARQGGANPPAAAAATAPTPNKGEAGANAKHRAETAAPEAAELVMEARLAETAPIIRQGLQWRIYGTNPGLGSKLPLIAQASGGSARFSLKPGNYIAFVAFGRASISKTIHLTGGKTQAENFNLNAGGLKLNAIAPEGKINEKQLHFAIYNEGQINEQKPLIEDAKAGEIIRLPAGSYYIVCNYGLANAVTRSDIRIEAGKLIEAIMQQRAAQIILKLVRQAGGEALADTSWAIMNDSGDIVREIANANAYIILAEGNYVAVAKNKDQIYQKGFTVSSGKDEEIEVPATPQNSIDEDGLD